MEKLSRIVCTILIAACFCANAKGNIFGKEKETVFSYSADVRTGTVDPASYASQFGLTSTLTIQSNKDGSSAVFHLRNISLQLYNGPLSFDEQSEASFLSTSHESLEEPFEVIYSNGLVKTIHTNEKEESVWSTNMKKSIAGILQLDMSKLHFDKSYSFPSQEKTLHGTCHVDYSVVSKKEGNAKIRKMPSFTGCKGKKTSLYWANLEGVSCTSESRRTFDRRGERLFEVHSSGDDISIQNVVTQGMVSFSPYPEEGFSQYIQVKQTFQLESQHPSSKYHSIEGMKENDLTFIPLDLEKNSETYDNLKGEKSAETKSILISQVQKQLHELIDLVEEIRVGGPDDQGGFLEKKQNEHSHQLLFQAMRTLRLLDYESLEKIFSFIDVGTSYREETLRDLFLELSSQTGTEASIILLKDLIVKNAVKTETAQQILKTIPFYAHQPDEGLLKIYEDVLSIQYDDQVKQAATLSFATMVNHACKDNKCSPEVLDKYILKYLELFKDSSDYKWQLNYLEGLSNIQIGNVVKYLEPIIKGDQPYSHHIRFLAMWATHQTAIKDPERVFEVYWPILEDKSEHLELRIGAFTILLLSKPQPDRFHSLAALMAEEPEGSHLYYFFYSSMESLWRTSHPCYQELKKAAEHILLYAKPPQHEPTWTGNHMFDYIDTSNKHGSFLQAFLVADQTTLWPNVIYFLHNEHFLGHNQHMMSFYVKIQGVKKIFMDMISKYSRDGDKLTHLQQLLSKYGVPEVVEEDQNLHVELIIQYQQKAVMTYYYNQTTLVELLSSLNTAGGNANGDFHLNYQRLMFPMISELTAPTDLGVPMSLINQTPFLFSLRGNFTADGMESKIARKNQIDIKYWRQAESFLSVYNPVGNLWHGISRVHSTLIHIPLNLHISFDIKQKNAKFSLTRNDNTIPGIAIHSGSNVFTLPLLSVEDSRHKTLTQSCPSCVPYLPVKGENYHEKLEYENEELGRLKMNYVYRYFDCDVEDIPFVIDNAVETTDVSLSDRLLDGLGLLLPLQYYNSLIHLPISGRCGFVAKITPEPQSDINSLIGVVQFTTEDSKSKEKKKIFSAIPDKEKYLIRGSLSQETSAGVAEQLYDFSFNYQQSQDSLHQSLKFELSGNDSEQLKMCLDAEINFPEPPVDPIKQREPEKEAVYGAINAVIGLANHNKCPKIGIVFKMTGRATPNPDKDKECYRVCTKEKESPEWAYEISRLTPSTPACFEAAIDSTQLRRFEFKTEVSQFISDLASKMLYAFYVEDGTDPWGKYKISSDYSAEEHPVIKDGTGFVLEFAENGFLIVDTIEDEERERVIFDYLIPSPLNSRYSEYKLTDFKENLIDYCVITASSVLTLNGSQLSHEVSPCYTLALGHCHTSNPQFAVLVRKVEETNKLAVRVYSFANYVEIIPGANNALEMNSNGEHFEFDRENAFEKKDGLSSLRVWQRRSKNETNSPLYLHIQSEPSSLLVDYTGDRILVEINTLLGGDACGLCGNYVKPQSERKWDVCEDSQ